MKLYSYWRSTTSYRVRAVLNLKKVEYEIIPVDLLAGDQKSSEYTDLNPGAGVPTLVLDDGSVLTQSMVILEYIDTVWPEPRLIPQDPMERARHMAAAHSIALDVHPVNNLRVARQLKERFEADDQDVRSWMQNWMQDGFRAIEALLSDNKTFAFGDQISITDICITAQAYNAHRWGVDLDAYPKIKRIEEQCLTVPEVLAAHPDNQPEAKEI